MVAVREINNSIKRNNGKDAEMLDQSIAVAGRTHLVQPMLRAGIIQQMELPEISPHKGNRKH